MTWDEQTPTIGRLYSDRLVEAFGPRARAARPSSTDAARGRRRRAAGDARGGVPPPRPRRLHERTGSPNLCLAGGVALNAVANGRIRPETPFEERLRPARRRRRRHAVGAAFYVWHQELGQPRGFVMEHAYTGPEYDDDGVRGGARAPAGFERRAARRRRALPARRRADRGGRRRRLVPGADGVRPARARQPLDRRRPAPARHEGHPQRAHQAPRAVPAVRALDPRRGDRRVVRAGLPVAVHGARLQDARGQARADPGGQPRRRHRPPADGRAARRTRATTG